MLLEVLGLNLNLIYHNQYDHVKIMTKFGRFFLVIGLFKLEFFTATITGCYPL